MFSELTWLTIQSRKCRLDTIFCNVVNLGCANFAWIIIGEIVDAYTDGGGER